MAHEFQQHEYALVSAHQAAPMRSRETARIRFELWLLHAAIALGSVLVPYMPLAPLCFARDDPALRQRYGH